MSKLFVYGLSYCSKEVLASAFGSCGKVDDVYNTGKVWFVTMADEAGADKAVAELNGRKIEGIIPSQWRRFGPIAVKRHGALTDQLTQCLNRKPFLGMLEHRF